MTRIVLLSEDIDMIDVRDALRAQAPDLQVSLQGEPGAFEAEVAACWNPPAGSFARMPNLRLVHSIAAGIDNLRRDPTLPDVPVCRIVDPEHRQGMAEYVLWGVLHFHRHMDRILANQVRRIWDMPAQQPASARTIGVMGLGALGGHVAQTLAERGFHVRGWARSAKKLDGVETYAGERSLADFLTGLDMVVCLLPMTEQTRGVLDARAFARLVRGAVIINCGRGEHVVLQDLRQALESGQVRGALLDVFEQEPLSSDDALWTTPGVIVTPHIASCASREAVAAQIIANVRRLERGEPLQNQADPAVGY
ncbi:2-hydroxyacid dehydrogenase [Pseudomonas sp. Marseille-QA0892]